MVMLPSRTSSNRPFSKVRISSGCSNRFRITSSMVFSSLLSPLERNRPGTVTSKLEAAVLSIRIIEEGIVPAVTEGRDPPKPPAEAHLPRTYLPRLTVKLSHDDRTRCRALVGEPHPSGSPAGVVFLAPWRGPARCPATGHQRRVRSVVRVS